MNSAARALAQGGFSNVVDREFLFSRNTLGILLLTLAVLASALAVVYVKALDRQLYCNLQSLVAERDALHVTSGQLLLEQNTWAAPERIQVVAERSLGMVLPSSKEVTVVTFPKVS